jgi:diguanylate cyclase (GGDEF)-like protein
MDIQHFHGPTAPPSTIVRQLKSTVMKLGFEQPLEGEFREDFLQRSLLRARVSTLIYLALLGVLSVINVLGGLTSSSNRTVDVIFVLRAGVLCPALALILVATYAPFLRAYYQIIVVFAAAVAGVAVMWITTLAATAAVPQFAQMGNVLVVVYGCLFLGLLFPGVVVVAAIHVAAFIVSGLALGIPLGNLAFGGALLTGTALMAVLSARRVERLIRTSFIEKRLLNEVAQRDGLTGLLNRRAFDALTERLWRQSRRENESLQLLLIDIDFFKQYNDRYGHQAGDDCLRKVARIVERSAHRPFDFCARYGGEELALFVYGQARERVMDLPEQIHEAVSAERIPHKGSNVAGVLTVSIGSAFLGPESKRTLAGLIQAADEALYEAKHAGRDRVVYKDADMFPGTTGSFHAITGKSKTIASE